MCCGRCHAPASQPLTEPVTIGSPVAKLEAINPPKPIAGSAPCTTFQDICDLVTTYQVANTPEWAETHNYASEASISATYCADVIGEDNIDSRTLFQICNDARSDSASASSYSGQAYNQTVDTNTALGNWVGTGETVRSLLLALNSQIVDLQSSVDALAATVDTINTDVGDVHVQTSGIEAAVIIDFAKWLGGTVAVPLAEWILGQFNTPNPQTLTPLTAIDITSGDDVPIEPGQYGVTLFIDAPVSWGHRFGHPNYYTPALGYMAFYGLDGWLMDPIDVHSEFREFVPFPAGATSWSVDLAVGVTGTYTILVLE